MQNAVIYARYSSRGQNEQTIEGQIRVCREYAAQKKLNIVSTYVDKHKTGTNVNRPEFQRMIEDAKTGNFQYIIVYMLDRFQRNRVNSAIYNWKLSQFGVSVISATENISESEEGEFYQMFLEWNAERYSKSLSKRVKEGLTTSVENGTYGGGKLIYGYKAENKRIYINVAEADILKYAFEKYAKGVTKTELAKDLNDKGLRFKGKPFNKRTFEKIFTNEKYTGSFMFGGRLCNKTYPQIIDRYTFDAVQKRLEKNKLAAGANSAKVPYLLQGKLYCGHCGANMISDSGTSKHGNLYRYYVCANRKKKHTCNKLNENKEYIEWYITEQTVNYLSDPQRVNFIASDVIKYRESMISTVEIKRLINEKTKTKKEIDNAINAMISTSNPDIHRQIEAKLIELNQLLNDLDVRQNQLEHEQGLKVTKADIVEFINQFVKGKILDKAFQKRIIDNLVNAVYLYDDKVVIYFNIKQGKEIAFVGKDETDGAMDETMELMRDAGLLKCSDFAPTTPPKNTASRQYLRRVFIA